MEGDLFLCAKGGQEKGVNRCREASIPSTCTLLKPDISIDAVSADPDDNRILERTIKANADFMYEFKAYVDSFIYKETR